MVCHNFTLKHFSHEAFFMKRILGQDLVLLNNKEILIDHKIVFYKEWFEKGIMGVYDLLTKTGTIFSHIAFTMKNNLI